MRLINNREYEQFGRAYGPQIYGYLLGVLVLTVLGMILQGYFVPETPEQKEEKIIEKNNWKVPLHLSDVLSEFNLYNIVYAKSDIKLDFF